MVKKFIEVVVTTVWFFVMSSKLIPGHVQSKTEW